MLGKVTNTILSAFRLLGVVLLLAANAHAQSDDTAALKNLLRQANGRVARLRAGRVYHVSEKLQLDGLCPRGVTIEGNGATIKALPETRHGVLLTATNLLRDNPYAGGVTIRDVTLDGDGNVSRCLFGNWKQANIENMTVRGGTVYQVNAVWHDSQLSRLDVQGNPDQTDNGFDCNLQNSIVSDVVVNMHGNLKESAFWLNGCHDATVVRPVLIDGRTAFGLENCQGVNVINMQIRGKFSFRVVNILPAKPSRRIHLYNIDLEATHVGDDAAAGVHFNATQGGRVIHGKIRSSGPGVLLTNGATEIDVVGVDLPSEPLYPREEWLGSQRRNMWISKRRLTRRRINNQPPVVVAGVDRVEPTLNDIELDGVAVDEYPTSRLMIRWSKLDGPGEVAFADANSARTKVAFSRPGTYSLQLAANDGKFESQDELRLEVGAGRERR